MTVAVVGAGIAGRLLAWRLARRGVAVTLFDRGDWASRDACSYAAAGLLAPAAETAAGGEAALCAQGFASMAAWPELLSGLPRPVTLGQGGTLTLAREATRPELVEFHARLARRLPDVRAVLLDAAALVRLEPGLAGCGYTAGLHLADEGYIASHAALAALGEALAASPHVSCRLCTEVFGVEPGTVRTAAGREAFAAVADCRGFGARGDLPLLRGVRGEIVELHAPDVALTRPVRVPHQRYPVYIVPRGPAHYAVGATCLESESLAPVSVQAALELLGAAAAAHPGFRFAQVTGLTANCRPAFPDNLPRVTAAPGLVRLNGLYRHGFLLAPLLTAQAEEHLLRGAG